MDIAVWLRSLSLEQYEAAFRENAIDADVLHDLTDQDLEKLGVLLGHRRRLLRAIAALDGTVATSSALAPLKVKPSPAAEAAGDRRHVTVMFCDLVDSTGIAAKLDAEEWRDLLGTYVDGASAAVTELGGKIIRKQGDGLMVLFGYPVALENDAERAARAALAIHRSLAELNRKNAGSGKPPLAARIAIDWGPVLVEGNELFGAQHRGPRPGGGRAGRGRGHGAGAAADRRSVRCRGARQSRIQRRVGAGDLVSPRARERCPTPRGAAPSHAANRS
jgi:class 3 adenylate cyclase